MSRFRFRDVDGVDVAPEEWLRTWAALFPSTKYYEEEYDALIENHKSLSAADFQRIGKWKDSAKTQGKWKANVASVAYEIWMQAAKATPACPEESQVAAFLNDWSERKYVDHFPSRKIEKHFGLSTSDNTSAFRKRRTFPYLRQAGKKSDSSLAQL